MGTQKHISEFTPVIPDGALFYASHINGLKNILVLSVLALA